MPARRGGDLHFGVISELATIRSEYRKFRLSVKAPN
jgi:hypothetical protein